ncbi:MAG TPA: ShlB/FhaC/HecB family hemolysin secretion/activation protein [Limnohabitans sp.]|uniref:ShlB/FhaC/HecB family hemolysin secretion/activation protein n=1 Tax=Limnohabitans sp. TaxID=1907725 RepID=UPI002C612E5E|nr:ShlB/FhaC/HecB family hemolysin secretion/activation protein [Limnohabitans sp.]HQR85711.1 ShlB/FhaC/HecB family hemolysin secretion/activation protein [Limnohabitans sp.]HQS26372.1 ShlB/FhaC/HecB family hemolysin secretion/activation protein [Limnohabitans sp.]
MSIYDPVLPKNTGAVLRAIENKTKLPVTEWTEAITGKPITANSTELPSPAEVYAPGTVGALMEKIVEEKEVIEAAKSQITLKSITFKGVTILGDMELKGLVEPFINTPMTYEQMLEIGMVVESYYRSNNYLARAILPPQDLTDGVLTVDVIESVFSKVEVEQELADLPNTQAHVVAIIESQQKIGEPLNAKSLDRALALANDVPGISAQGSLRQGREAGETELLLKLYQGRTRQAELSMDNAGSRSTGFMRVMASMTWFNPNDMADLLNVVAVHTKGSDYARLAYSIPVGVDGWRMGMNISALKYEVVVGEEGILGAVGHSLTKGMEWLYPLIRRDDVSATVSLTADIKNFKNTSAQSQLISDYDTKVVAAQVSGFMRDINPGGGTGTYSVQLSHGNVNLQGSPSLQTDQTGVKTAGAFNKLRVAGTWLQPITTETSAFISYTGQVADKNLDSSEKMQLGGMNGVRAYPTGEGSGVDGQLIQLELRHNLGSGINLAGFYDWGQIWLQHDPNYPGGPQHNRNTYRGFGASVAYTNDDGVNFRASWARRQGHNPNPTQTGTDQDGTRDRNRYWLQVTVPF